MAPVVHTQGMSPSFTAQHHFTTLSDSRCIYHTAPAPDRMTLIRRVSAPDTVFRQQSFTTVAQLIGLIITFNLLPVSFCVVWFHKSLSLGCFTSGTKRTQRKSRKVVSASPSGPSIIQRFFLFFGSKCLLLEKPQTKKISTGGRKICEMDPSKTN